MNKEKYDRAIILLDAAKQLLEKQHQSRYVLNLLYETANYDDTVCDGFCLLEDIQSLIGEE